MKCLNLFSGKNKKFIINFSSAEYAPRAVKVKMPFKIVTDNILKTIFLLSVKIRLYHYL